MLALAREGKRIVRVSGQSRPQEALAPFGKETWIASAMIIASNPDRAMTVREWDPVLQRSAWLCQLVKIAALPRG